ncbi:MAG: DedA family protein [Alphaproteobacteria bacterium]|nr:DedA family protein [Alphaproteobacteria bacterium]
MEIIEWIRNQGPLFYVITFAWTFLEGETFVLFAGVAARMDILRLDLLIACAWIGSFCGDQCYFWLGRRYGKRLIERFPRMKPGVDSALGFLAKWNTLFILTYRFIYGVRNFSSVAMGMSPLPWLRFLWLNFIAAGIWACTFAGVGYAFGAAMGSMLEQNALAVLYSMLGLFLTLVVLKGGFALWKHRRDRRAALAASTTSNS